MMRGTFANIRIRNQMVARHRRRRTRHICPTGEVDVHLRRRHEVSGRRHSRWSSWPARSTAPAAPATGRPKDLPARRQGGHRRELRADPPQQPGRHGRAAAAIRRRPDSWQSLGLTGEETFDIVGLNDEIQPGQEVKVRATKEDGTKVEFHGDRPPRQPGGDRVLPERRHPADRSASDPEQPMKMKPLRIHHAQITIPRGAEEEARHFYCEVMGLTEIPKPDSLKGRARSGSGSDVEIHVGTEDGGGRNRTKAHLAYQVEDLESWRRHLTEQAPPSWTPSPSRALTASNCGTPSAIGWN